MRGLAIASYRRRVLFGPLADQEPVATGVLDSTKYPAGLQIPIARTLIGSLRATGYFSSHDDKRTIRHALNVLSLSPWIFRSITLTNSVARSFVWPLTSGLFLLLHGLSGLRRGTGSVSNYVIIDGLFWS